MARIQWVEARLWNWARWKQGGRSGGLGFAKVNLEAAGVDRNREAIIPIDDDEARITDQAVAQLTTDLQRVLKEVYLEPGPMATIARDMGLGESTLYARLYAAHRGIAGWIGEREKRAQVERGRVEALAR